MTDVVKNRALAYEKENDRWRLDMYFGNDRGGGGALLSTAGDLAHLERRADERSSRRVRHRKASGTGKAEQRQEARLRPRPDLEYSAAAASWCGIAAARPGTAHSWAVFRNKDSLVAILCNADEGARSAYASRIFDLFLPPAVGGSAAEANAPAANAGGAGVTGADLSGRAGLFFNEHTGEPLRLVVNNDTLRIAGGGPLVALANDRFRNQRTSLSFMSQDEFELHFLSADQFELKSMEGETTRYRRAQPYAPTAADLQAFAGRYESDEIGIGLRDGARKRRPGDARSTMRRAKALRIQAGRSRHLSC